MNVSAHQLQARGRATWDLKTLPDREFEQLCFRLVLLEHPGAVKPGSVGDRGADALLPALGVGWQRAWQAKHYPGSRIAWDKCEKSLEDALEHYHVRHYTFCFPRDLRGDELKQFDTRLRAPHPSVTVDFWDASNLLARLDASDEGRRVARSFFADPQTDMEAVARAAAAGGPLASAQDALDRMGTVGEFLGSSDAFFTYSGAVAEAGHPMASPAPGAMLSVIEVEGPVVRRLDAVPRDAEAAKQHGPRGRLRFADDEAGQRAYERALTAIQHGMPATLQAGTQLLFDQLPPLLAGEVGRPLEGRIDLLPERRTLPPWPVRLRAISDRGRENLSVTLRQSVVVPDGWDEAWEEQYGALRVQVLVRLRDPAEISIDYGYRYDPTVSMAKHLKGLRFLIAVGGAGRLELHDRRHRVKVVDVPTEAVDGAPEQTLLRYLEDLQEIGKWTGSQMRPTPEPLEPEEIAGAARTAHILRKRGMWVNLETMTLKVDGNGLRQLREDGQLVFTQELGIHLSGRDIPLGMGWVHLPRYRLQEPPERLSEGLYRVRIEPATDEERRLWMTLEQGQASNGAGKQYKRGDGRPRGGARGKPRSGKRRKR